MALYVQVSDAFDRLLGSVVIHNDGTGDYETGNYNIKEPGGEPFARIEDYRRGAGFWLLVARAAVLAGEREVGR